MFHSSMNFYWHLGEIVDDENYYIEREKERVGCEGEGIVFELLYIWLAGSATNLFMR